MKSMEQMQNEIFSQARWDGGYPKAMIVGMCVALAHNDEEEKQLQWHQDFLLKFMVATWVAAILAIAYGAYVYLPW